MGASSASSAVAASPGRGARQRGNRRRPRNLARVAAVSARLDRLLLDSLTITAASSQPRRAARRPPSACVAQRAEIAADHEQHGRAAALVQSSTVLLVVARRTIVPPIPSISVTSAAARCAAELEQLWNQR
jgi:hypothetical protein